MTRSFLAFASGAALTLACIRSGGTNHDPRAAADTSLAVAGRPLVLDVLANDSDSDGDPLALLGASAPAHGTATSNPDGTITYTAAAGYRGADAFGYTVTDGKGGTASGTVTLTVHLIANEALWVPAGAWPMLPVAVADAAGGTIVAWMDVRPDGIDLRVKRVGQWGPGGVLVSTIHGP